MDYPVQSSSLECEDITDCFSEVSLVLSLRHSKIAAEIAAILARAKAV